MNEVRYDNLGILPLSINDVPKIGGINFMLAFRYIKIYSTLVNILRRYRFHKYLYPSLLAGFVVSSPCLLSGFKPFDIAPAITRRSNDLVQDLFNKSVLAYAQYA